MLHSCAKAHFNGYLSLYSIARHNKAETICIHQSSCQVLLIKFSFTKKSPEQMIIVYFFFRGIYGNSLLSKTNCLSTTQAKHSLKWPVDTLYASKTLPHWQNIHHGPPPHPRTWPKGKARPLDPVEFIERISHFIPYPRRHRRHYHGAFAPSSPLRKHIAANAQKRLDASSKVMQETAERIAGFALWPSPRVGQGPHANVSRSWRLSYLEFMRLIHLIMHLDTPIADQNSRIFHFLTPNIFSLFLLYQGTRKGL